MSFRLEMRQQGFTLTEVIVAVASLGVVILVMHSVVNMAINASYLFESVVTRDDLQRTIIQNLGSAVSIANTRAKNPEFNKCFMTGAASCKSNEIFGLTIYDQNDNILTGPGPGFANAVSYDRYGSKCSATSGSECSFQVVTTFHAQGAPSFCGYLCQAIVPVDYPPVGRRHELLIVQYLIFYMGKTSKIALSERAGSVTLTLDDLP